MPVINAVLVSSAIVDLIFHQSAGVTQGWNDAVALDQIGCGLGRNGHARPQEDDDNSEYSLRPRHTLRRDETRYPLLFSQSRRRYALLDKFCFVRCVVDRQLSFPQW